jgi:hypothetical protein
VCCDACECCMLHVECCVSCFMLYWRLSCVPLPAACARFWRMRSWRQSAPAAERCRKRVGNGYNALGFCLQPESIADEVAVAVADAEVRRPPDSQPCVLQA